MTRRHVESLAHLDKRVCILEEWLTSTCTPQMHIFRDAQLMHTRQLANLGETVQCMEKRYAQTQQGTIKHGEIQQQVDTIREMVLRIDGSLNKLLTTRENK